ncbi:MAG: hypothetical protein OSB38_33295 [Paraburkholderia fungorum]|nr:hypothetical protein [Paraburkholderia fungorum]
MAYSNKSDQAACAKRQYEANKSVYIARATAAKKAKKIEMRALLRSYLLTHPCVDCGEPDIVVLEFDHRAGVEKKFDIGAAVTRGFSKRAIEEEIAKCDVRCANCHRRKTYKERGFNHRDPD